MLYVSLDDYLIKILYVKKSLLGQYEAGFYKKALEIKILEDGKITNPDVVASAVQEALAGLSAQQPVKDKEITLILPQGAFAFMRADLPVDIGTNVLQTYLAEKARSTLQIDPDLYSVDYFIQENEGKKQILFYAIDPQVIEQAAQPFKLLDLQVVAIIPESLALFELFEKTLRKDKKENIFYVSYNDKRLGGYVYDSFGLLDGTKWVKELDKKETVETVLKNKAAECELEGKKLNRLILSGPTSDTVRQDTFTKQVGVWTNPLKRIIPNFYQEYVKLLSTDPNVALPVLDYEECIGAFIFCLENKTFSLMKKRPKSAPLASISMPSGSAVASKIPFKQIGIFLVSFGATMALLYLLSQMNLQKMSFAMPAVPFLTKTSPSPTPSPSPAPPTATPTPAFDKSAIKVKLLNGSGVKGKASEIKALLKEKGYEEILTANAKNFDYEVTEIQLKKSKAELQRILKEDLKDNVPEPDFTALDEDEAADVVIIFGKDFK
jgi:hypothetical protein